MNNTTNGFYARVALGSARKVDADLIAFVLNVITLMTGNAQYPSPTPSLDAVTVPVKVFEKAVHDALDGGKIIIASAGGVRSPSNTGG